MRKIKNSNTNNKSSNDSRFDNITTKVKEIKSCNKNVETEFEDNKSLIAAQTNTGTQTQLPVQLN